MLKVDAILVAVEHKDHLSVAIIDHQIMTAPWGENDVVISSLLETLNKPNG